MHIIIKLYTDIGAEGRVVIENTSQRKRILESVHNSSHFGINRTLDLVSHNYYWPGLTKDVKYFVSACPSVLFVYIILM